MLPSPLQHLQQNPSIHEHASRKWPGPISCLLAADQASSSSVDHLSLWRCLSQACPATVAAAGVATSRPFDSCLLLAADQAGPPVVLRPLLPVPHMVQNSGSSRSSRRQSGRTVSRHFKGLECKKCQMRFPTAVLQAPSGRHCTHAAQSQRAPQRPQQAIAVVQHDLTTGMPHRLAASNATPC
jgi:hypothetical protein